MAAPRRGPRLGAKTGGWPATDDPESRPGCQHPRTGQDGRDWQARADRARKSLYHAQTLGLPALQRRGRAAYGVAMRLTHLGHACLLVEIADTRILIDPGMWSPRAFDQRDVHAVLVTHQHPDHLDQERLPELLRANPGAELLADPGTTRLLREKGIDAEAFEEGDEVAIGGARLAGAGADHALIHDDIQRIPNTGVRISAAGEPTLFHPGDALDAEPGEVDVLAFPLNAPWMRSREMTAFLRRFNAPYAVPVHDALLSERGRNLYLTQANSLGGPDTHIRDLGSGEPEEFRA